MNLARAITLCPPHGRHVRVTEPILAHPWSVNPHDQRRLRWTVAPDCGMDKSESATVYAVFLAEEGMVPTVRSRRPLEDRAAIFHGGLAGIEAVSARDADEPGGEGLPLPPCCCGSTGVGNYGRLVAAVFAGAAASMPRPCVTDGLESTTACRTLAQLNFARMVGRHDTVMRPEV
jgi:hypothetical protein